MAQRRSQRNNHSAQIDENHRTPEALEEHATVVDPNGHETRIEPEGMRAEPTDHGEPVAQRQYEPPRPLNSYTEAEILAMNDEELERYEEQLAAEEARRQRAEALLQRTRALTRQAEASENAAAEPQATNQTQQNETTGREDPMAAAVAELIATSRSPSVAAPVKPPKFDPERRYVTKGIPQKRAFESELKYHFMENPWYYTGPEADKRKIITAVKAFGEDMRARWDQEVNDGADIDEMTWNDFDNFLIRQINSPELLRKKANRVYATLTQRENQSVTQFNIALRNWESQLSIEYTEEQRKAHLMARVLESIEKKSNGWHEPTNPSYDAYVTWLQGVEDSMPERQRAIRGPRNESTNGSNNNSRTPNSEAGSRGRGRSYHQGGRGASRGRSTYRFQPYSRDSHQQNANNSNGFTPSNSCNNDVTCGHCHKPGHTEKDCWILHPELRPKRDDYNNRDKP